MKHRVFGRGRCRSHRICNGEDTSLFCQKKKPPCQKVPVAVQVPGTTGTVPGTVQVPDTWYHTKYKYLVLYLAHSIRVPGVPGMPGTKTCIY
jgi:hypothetical protein